jgi:hypothetical protein
MLSACDVESESSSPAGTASSSFLCCLEGGLRLSLIAAQTFPLCFALQHCSTDGGNLPLCAPQDNPPVNCTVSDWSDWTPACTDCTQTRTRTITVQPQYGGKPCPELLQTRVVFTTVSG